MQKLTYRHLQVGKVYNRVYTGPNEAYAAINGKETFRVISVEPNLVCQILFDQFGSPMEKEITGGHITFPVPEKAFEEFDIFTAPDRNDWFIKSAIMTVADALEQGFITMDMAKQSALHVTCYNWGDAFYMSCQVDESRRPKQNPYLQTVFFVWKSHKEMEDDLLENKVATRVKSKAES